MTKPSEHDEDAPDFEDVVSALLKVDPKGIAGKHRKEKPEDEDPPSE